MRFEIEGIFKIKSRNKVYILAKLLDLDQKCTLTDKSRLGNVEIEKWFDIPRAHDNDGNLRSDLFAFAMKRSEDESKLQINQVVELVP